MSGGEQVHIKPSEVLIKIAQAIPEDCHDHLIIIGSLAVGYHYFKGDAQVGVRTKDADCMLSPYAQAVPKGEIITNRLFDEGWVLRSEGDHGAPGNAATPLEKLPVVRMRPKGEAEWFLELLTVPSGAKQKGKKWDRLETNYGHFGICSFGFLSLVNYKPIRTELGIYVARPEMMALANLLEHPEIGDETMSGGFAGQDDIKRSNKDLGRVLAIARLAALEDEDVFLDWPEIWKDALQARFPETHQELGARLGSGLRELINSPQDLEQAKHTCANGLLVSHPPSVKVLELVGKRLLKDAIDPVENGCGKASG